MTHPDRGNPADTNHSSLEAARSRAVAELGRQIAEGSASLNERLRRDPRDDADLNTLSRDLSDYVSRVVPALSVDSYAAMVYRVNRAAGL